MTLLYTFDHTTFQNDFCRKVTIMRCSHIISVSTLISHFDSVICQDVAQPNVSEVGEADADWNEVALSTLNHNGFNQNAGLNPNAYKIVATFSEHSGIVERRLSDESRSEDAFGTDYMVAAELFYDIACTRSVTELQPSRVPLSIALTHQNFTDQQGDSWHARHCLEADANDKKRFEKIYNFGTNHDINCVRISSRRCDIGPNKQVKVEVFRSDGQLFQSVAQQSVIAEHGFVLENSDGRTHITADFHTVFPSGLSDLWVVFAQNLAVLLLFFVVYLLIERWGKYIKKLRKLNPLERTKLPENIWKYFEHTVEKIFTLFKQQFVLNFPRSV